MATVTESLHPGVEGVWIGACDVGGARALDGFLRRRGAVWTGGYACAVNWDSSLMIDLGVLQALVRYGPIRGRAKAVRVITRGLCGFQPSWIIGDDINGRPVPLDSA